MIILIYLSRRRTHLLKPNNDFPQVFHQTGPSACTVKGLCTQYSVWGQKRDELHYTNQRRTSIASGHRASILPAITMFTYLDIAEPLDDHLLQQSGNYLRAIKSLPVVSEEAQSIIVSNPRHSGRFFTTLVLYDGKQRRNQRRLPITPFRSFVCTGLRLDVMSSLWPLPCAGC